MNNLHINNSYNIWSIREMKRLIIDTALKEYNSSNPEFLLNRSYLGMYIEWWLHNVGYYITVPFCSNIKIYRINLRFRDVDLQEIIR